MKKSFFCFMYVMIVSAAIFAQQPIVAEAPPLLMMDPLTPDEVNSVGGVFAKFLAEAKNVRFINKLALDKGMRDYEFQRRDWFNVEKTIALGEVLNIDWVIRPQLQKRVTNNFNREISEIIMTAVLLNIRTKKIMYSTPVVLKNVTEAEDKMEAHINEITQIITNGTGGLTQSTQSLYKIGDRGPAGGWIFYDKGNYSDEWRYLELAPQMTETSVARSRHTESVNGTETGIGSGKKNTELILKSPNQDYQIVKAAKNCANMELNWFKDWFLPSQLELRKLFTTLEFYSHNKGGLNLGHYCSSSGSDKGENFNTIDKNQPYLVRAVRAF